MIVMTLYTSNTLSIQRSTLYTSYLAAPSVPSPSDTYTLHTRLRLSRVHSLSAAPLCRTPPTRVRGRVSSPRYDGSYVAPVLCGLGTLATSMLRGSFPILARTCPKSPASNTGMHISSSAPRAIPRDWMPSLLRLMYHSPRTSPLYFTFRFRARRTTLRARKYAHSRGMPHRKRTMPLADITTTGVPSRSIMTSLCVSWPISYHARTLCDRT